MLIPIWLSFLIALAIVMYLSKWELSYGLLLGGIFFGLFAEVSIVDSALITVLDLRNLFLALSVTLIPLLGGMMQESNLMMQLINNMNVSKKSALIASPAIFGLLPIPGGALMSAPIVDEIDPKLNPERKVAINVWYRHVLILIYPISSTLIIVSGVTGHSLYTVVASLLIPCLIMIIVGYFTLIRNVGSFEKQQPRNLKIVFRNIVPIIIAPIIDLIGRYTLDFAIPEVFMFIGLLTSVFLVLRLSKINEETIVALTIKNIPPIAKKMEVWKYPLLIYAMKFFIEIFYGSSMTEFLGSLEMHLIIYLLIGFFLGFATGRTEVPGPILIGIYLSQFALVVMPLFEFSLIYSAIFLGYVCTPIHPCIAYSLKYFKIGYNKMLKDISLPTIICFLIILIVYGLSLVF